MIGVLLFFAGLCFDDLLIHSNGPMYICEIRKRSRNVSSSSLLENDDDDVYEYNTICANVMEDVAWSECCLSSAVTTARREILFGRNPVHGTTHSEYYSLYSPI